MAFHFFRLVLILGLICAVSAQAIIHKVDIWQKSFGGSTQALYCFSDYHLDHANAAITKQQQQELLRAARAKDALWILEDPYYIEIDGNLKFGEVKSYHPLPADHTVKINDRTLRPGIQCGCFAGFGLLCEQQNIPFVTVEFRQRIIDHMHNGLAMNVAMASILDPIIHDLNDNQDHELRKFYDAEIEKLQKDDLYKICMEADRKQEESERKSTFEKDIQQLGNGLLECQIMRYVYQNKAQPMIFVGAGSAHIENIEPMLRALGYQKKKTIGQNYIEAADDSLRIDAIDIQTVFRNNQPERGQFLSYKKLFALAALLGCGYCAYKILFNTQLANLLWQSQ